MKPCHEAFQDEWICKNTGEQIMKNKQKEKFTENNQETEALTPRLQPLNNGFDFLEAMASAEPEPFNIFSPVKGKTCLFLNSTTIKCW